MTHRLKTWPNHFREVILGAKTFEIRLDDRNYAVDDTLVLAEYDPANREYTGQEYECHVTHKLSLDKGDDTGFLGAVIMKGWCVLSLGRAGTLRRHDKSGAITQEIELR